MLYRLKDEQPELRGEGHFIAPSASVIGRVILEERSSLWFHVTARGDAEQLWIGPESNVQDGAVLHADPGLPLRLGRGVTVGHQAMVHGCEVGEYSLIGIQSVVLNGARLGPYSMVAAGSVVTEGMVVPEGSLVAGVPAKIKRLVTDEERVVLAQMAAAYVANAARFCAELAPIK